MSKVLIQFAHPAFSKSHAQKVLVKYCRNIEGVTFNDLYEQYPDLYIDVKREQELLTQHDIIILQHPFYWYSGPAIIKQWLDLVLEYNWAYGPKGTALTGKKLLNVLSSGSSKESYGRGSHHNFSVAEFLFPFRQTANLCGMEYLPPFIVHGTHRISVADLEDHGKQYASILTQMVEGSITGDVYRSIEYLNELVNDKLA
jgi:glutathione-regulated potassium-efflux system ancillary protein KefG